MSKEEKQKLLNRYVIDDLQEQDIDAIKKGISEDEDLSMEFFLSHQIKKTLENEFNSYEQIYHQQQQKAKNKKIAAVLGMVLVVILLILFFPSSKKSIPITPSEYDNQTLDEHSRSVMQAAAANIKLKEAFKSEQTAGPGFTELDYYQTRTRLINNIVRDVEEADRHYYLLALLELYHPLGNKNNVLQNFEKSKNFYGRDKIPTHICYLFLLYEDTMIIS